MQIPATLTTLPNLITLGRIAAIPVICLFIALRWDWLQWLALLLYVVAAASDWLDGFLARRMNLNSALGKMLDPIADKLLVGALLITLAWTQHLTGWDLIPAIAIMLREIFISGLREYLGKVDVDVPVTWLAKWKTTIQLVALGLLIASPMLLGLVFIGHFLLWVAAILTVWTGWEYLRGAWPHLAGQA
ncbi:MAG: CDP-diacylglycerol--glycerol-3-phosphate 3-phosphatidyltransferase [Hyphomicrobiales bacterium]|nr:MAG: CDP-diacylglycerol--glycerol-3-phosphate 3-phosphatidyltransferase [Hyphomicrobiales bacterium]